MKRKKLRKRKQLESKKEAEKGEKMERKSAVTEKKQQKGNLQGLQLAQDTSSESDRCCVSKVWPDIFS